MTDPEFDTRFSSLGGIEPPDHVVRDTLRAVAQERARARWGRISIFAGGGLALAAAAMIAVMAPQVQHAPVLVTRGVGDVIPSLDLRVAVKQGDQVSRFAAGEHYAAGATLVFRVSTSEAMDLVLSRDGATLWSGHVETGDTDLPVAYALEAGEGAATFAVSGAGARQEIHVEAVAR